MDFIRGLRARLNYESELTYTAAEIAAGTKVRKSPLAQRSRYSDKVRKMIELEDKKDKAKGIIVNG